MGTGDNPLCSSLLYNLCSIVPIIIIKNNPKDKKKKLPTNAYIRAYRDFLDLGNMEDI